MGSRAPLFAPSVAVVIACALAACTRDADTRGQAARGAAAGSGAPGSAAASAAASSPLAASGAAAASSAVYRAAAEAGSAADAGAAASRGRALTADAKRTLARALAEGRSLAAQRRWTDAVAALARGRAVDPDEPRVLSELGWAAFNAGDLALAEEVSAHGLAATNDPVLRAQMAYNGGRAAEARGASDKAAGLYRESSRLRPNATVAARLAALQGDGGASSASFATRAGDEVPCAGPFPGEAALCACLDAQLARDSPIWAAQPRVCEVARRTQGGELLVVRQGVAEPPGETRYLAVGRSAAGLRVLAHLGSDFEPGAFGVHNSATLKGVEERAAGPLRLAIVRLDQVYTDFNLGGLEETTREEERAFVCVLADGTPTPRPAPRCAIDVPLTIHDVARYELPDDLDAEMRAEVLARKKQYEHDQRVELDLAIGAAGKVTVRLVRGAAELAPKDALGDRAP